MENLKNKIQELRPNLSKQSINTYSSILKSLYKNVFGESDDIDIDKYQDTKKILSFLEGIDVNKRKTILSALFVLTENKEYRNLMLKDIQAYNNAEGHQEMNDKQKESWVSGDDIKTLFNKLNKNVKLIYKKESLDPSDLQEIQIFIIISLLGGIYIPPRRSKDYVDFKIKNIDKTKDNYFYKNELVFNSFKTAKSYGQQKVTVPKELATILRKWIKNNPTDYLLFDSNKNQLSNVKLNQRLNKIFNKKVGVNQLRHTFLSDKYQNTINQNQELKKDFSMMGSSILQEKVYIKKL